MKFNSLCSIPTGIVAVLFAYLATVLSIRFSLPDCLDEPCQSEGVDDTILAWGSDFFVAFLSICLALHLHFFKRTTRKSSILAQIFMAGSFALSGINRILYPNSGQTDNRGIVEYWVVGSIAAFFLTLSAASSAYFAMETALTMQRSDQPCCGVFFMRLWLAACILVCLINIIGGVWCGLTSSVQTSDIHDNFADNLFWDERHVCLQLVGLSEKLIWFPYALLWIPMAMIFRAAAAVASKVRDEKILGLSTQAAAGLAIFSQWTMGAIFFTAVSFASWIRYEMGENDEEFLDLWNRIYGVEIFHLGMIITIYCLHNLGWVFSIPRKTTPNRRRSRMDVDTSTPTPMNIDQSASGEKQVRFGDISTIEDGTEHGEASLDLSDDVNKDSQEEQIEEEQQEVVLEESATDQNVESTTENMNFTSST